MFAKNTGKRFNPFGIEVGKIADTPESKAFWRSLVPPATQKDKNPQFDLKRSYRRSVEAATAFSIFFVILAFQVMKNVTLSARETKVAEVKVDVVDIPRTEQIHRPPPPPRPAVPVPTEDESVPEDATIASTDLDLTDLPEPPPPPEVTDESRYMFVAYDSPPTPVGGWSEIYKYVKYPELAVKSGVEGRVFVKVLVNEQGIVEDAEVMRSSNTNVGFEEAALAAARQVKWKPALQRDHPVKVWIGFPIQFKLSDDIRS